MMAATVICVLACAALVYAEVRGLARLRTAAKFVASGGFLVVGALATARSTQAGHAYALWIMLGLCFGAVGDIALLGRSTGAFLLGLVAFLVGHVLYVVAIATVVSPSNWVAPPAILPLAAAATALRWLWPHLGGLRYPVVVYVAAITAMVIGAMAATRCGELASPHCIRLMVGAVLFFLSDLAVARDRFVTRDVANKVWGLPAYFAGQLLIAWSILGA